MQLTDIFVNSIGTYLPDIVRAEVTDDESMTGAAVAGDLPSVDMALRATRQAIERWGQSTDLLALLLYVDVNHQGPDGWLAHTYLQRLAVGGHVLAAGIRQGCNGVLGSLQLASGYLRSLAEPRGAIITAADNLDSSLLDRWTAVGGTCLGDGGTALVLSRVPGFARLRSITSTTVTELEGLTRGSEPLHPSGAITGRRTSFRERSDSFVAMGAFPMELVLRTIKTSAEIVERALHEADIKIADINRVIVHHGPLQDIEVYLTAMGIKKEQTTWEWGRMVGHSASDHLFGLEHLLNDGEVGPGDHLLMFGVGPGLSIAAAVIEVVDQPPWLAR